MTTAHVDAAAIHVPAWVTDLTSFRRWVHSGDLPERAPIFYLAGEVWVDMTKEQIFTHVRLKQAFYQVLGPLADELQLGQFFPDGLLLTNAVADLSGNPDGTFVTWKSFRKQQVRLIEGAESGFVEMEGTPDMVLEIVSDSSVVKDTQVLRELYGQAGIREYWLADARDDRLEFTIFRYGSRGYAPVRRIDDWQKSGVFGHSFRLTRRVDALGYPAFSLAVRPS